MTANRDHLTRLYLNGAVALLDHLLAAERKADRKPSQRLTARWPPAACWPCTHAWRPPPACACWTSR